jgi:hypothetical protein
VKVLTFGDKNIKASEIVARLKTENLVEHSWTDDQEDLTLAIDAKNTDKGTIATFAAAGSWSSN